MKDTLRILVSWECNLHCRYCCNNQPQFRQGITPTRFEEIKWGDYQTFCITGGEPCLNMGLVEKVCAQIPAGKTIVFYTNGTIFTAEHAHDLARWGVQYVNVGLHFAPAFGAIIHFVSKAAEGTGLRVRFHAQDTYAEELQEKFPGVSFRFWKMNDCDRGNEDRIVLQ